uniref:Uncharacterized protein n=1 Tax=Vespula pensylvanica TaxID=30213 RepID=A0A834JVP4_VESPE|nr:hypothetical protein H0235_017076 [Vespula pensylvanica]
MQNTIDLRFNIIEEEDVTSYLTNDMARVNISEDSDTDFEIYFRHRCKRVRKLSSSNEDDNFSNNRTANVIPDPLT